MKLQVGLLVVLSFYVATVAGQSTAPASPKDGPVQAAKKSLPVFPDFGHMVSLDKYTGRTFKLSQDYPKIRPSIEPAVAQILQIDFTKDWQKYILAVRDYIYEGNVEGRNLSEAFYLEDNKVRRWHHVPWQHSGDHGREGVHGLTSEGHEAPGTLAPSQTNEWQTYAVGFYNDPGGWLIGQVWADPANPKIEAAKDGFPVGTVVGKVLFSTAPVIEVPWLGPPIEWTAYTAKKDSKKREFSRVRFIQMDIMVRDSRADAWGGWVFGTFVYNGALAARNSNYWYNIVPVGLQWGNDPTVTSYSTSNEQPTATEINPDLKETVINTSPDLPPMHLGYGRRLSGPVDNTKSSCMSCHAVAQYPRVSSMLPSYPDAKPGSPKPGSPKPGSPKPGSPKPDSPDPKPGSPEWMRWFRNTRSTIPFDQGSVSTDASWQLAGSLQNFNLARAAADRFQKHPGRPVQPIYGQRGSRPGSKQK